MAIISGGKNLSITVRHKWPTPAKTRIGGASYAKFEPILNVNESSSDAGSATQSLSKGDLALLLEQAARHVATLRVMLLAIARSLLWSLS